ncbi:MAG: hypothetical protein H6Q20_962 [Bacteroidetes bacterium]|nr:hypothetical protein [Bacteroidota bacterium]
MMMKKLTIYLSTLTILLTSCVTEYNVDLKDAKSGILVVEGIISSDSTEIQLSRSVALDQELSDDDAVNGAELFIEDSNGRLTGPFQQKGNGKYFVRTGTLDQNYKYRLRIILDNEEYESEFLNPIKTAAIDSITWSKEGKGKPVQIHVNTHDPTSQSNYYQWSYTEIWEFHAEIFANAGYENGKLVVYSDLPDSIYNNKYYCWITNKSKSILLGTTDLLTENIIRKKVIKEIDPTDKRLSTLYYIEITQNQIRKAAYDYFANIKKNIDESGSIFSPIPTEMQGNIKCVTNKDIQVIGYVDVSSGAKKELFIPFKGELYEYKPNTTCVESDKQWSGYLLSTYDPLLGNSYAPAQCIDCKILGGTKNKPWFWPNNHK